MGVMSCAGFAERQGLFHRLLQVVEGVGQGDLPGLEVVVEHLDDLQELPPVDAFAGVGEERGAHQGKGRDHGNLIYGLHQFQGPGRC